MEKLVSLCKRRGFIFPGSEIYGGLGAFWDYGPLGVELKSNVRQAWWRAMVQERDDVVGLDSAILMHPQTWVASGHVQGFTDPLVECKSCHLRWREDMAKDGRCPSCGGELTEPRMFNLMFRTHVGPVEEDSTVVYLRPETAQGIFLNFQNILASSRKKVPFGIAQIGKAFRNEISPGNFIFRTREFEQMEMEYFVRPGTDEEWFKYWVEERFKWYLSLGIKKQNLRLRLHGKEELAHYAKDCHDVEYLFPMGWSELEGIANRGDFDLRQHSQSSGKALDYFDEETGQHFIPYVIEPSAGVDRTALALLVDAYDEEPDKEGIRVVLRFKFSMAPVQVAVLPLSRKENLMKLAQELYARLRKSFRCQYDDAQSIGRRYRRQDEIGTPLCVTVDFQSLEDNMVTLRHRDSMEQIRVPIAALQSTISAKLEGEAFLAIPPGGQAWATQQGAGQNSSPS